MTENEQAEAVVDMLGWDACEWPGCAGHYLPTDKTLADYVHGLGIAALGDELLRAYVCDVCGSAKFHD